MSPHLKFSKRISYNWVRSKSFDRGIVLFSMFSIKVKQTCEETDEHGLKNPFFWISSSSSPMARSFSIFDTLNSGSLLAKLLGKDYLNCLWKGYWSIVELSFLTWAFSWSWSGLQQSPPIYLYGKASVLLTVTMPTYQCLTSYHHRIHSLNHMGKYSSG